MPIRFHTIVLALALALLTLALAGAQEVTAIDEVVVTARGLPGWVGEDSYAVQYLDGDDLRRQPDRQTLDAMLRSTPGFRLFRRTDSAVAHPTTQGVSLRNTGPNAASRTLVFLDGMPQNDPFGGWVPWTKIPPSALGQITLVRDGGVGPLGNNALGGTILLETGLGGGENLGQLSVRTGEALAADGLGFGNVHFDHSGTAVFGGVRRVEFDGYPVIAASQRGPLDHKAGHDLDWFTAGMAQDLGDDWRLVFRVEAFEEDRSNGTPLARNRTEGIDFSASLAREETEFHFYRQDRDFASTFTAVDSDRRTERLVLDQFAVPSESLGGSLRHTVEAGGHSVTVGADTRWVKGFTNERFRNLGAGFTRQRRAGGEQWQSGVFLLDTWQVSETVEVAAAARLDHRQRRRASRFESDLATGAALTDEKIADSNNWSGSARLGILWDAADFLAVRASLFTGTREPTLNELYRPFRVGNDITEPNAALEEERLTGVDLGFEWSLDDELTIAASAFYNRLDDAVGNVTLAEGPGVIAPWGFIPAGGTGRQRQNLDRIDVAGFELTAAWQPIEQLRFDASYLYTHAEISDTGARVPQVPRHQASASAILAPTELLTVGTEMRFTSEQFEDDRNTIRLNDAFVTDLFVHYQLTENCRLSATLENVFDETIETRRTADELTSIGAPRLWSFGVQMDF